LKLGNNRRYGQLPRNTDWQDKAVEFDPELEEATTEAAAPASAADNSYDFLQTPADAASDTPAAPEECSSVIGSGSTWQGNLTTDASVRLEGKVSGDIKASGTVHITDGAQVNATVHARFVIISGSFDGKLYCTERLELRPSSRIQGSITTRSLSVGEGAFIDGEIHMTDEVPDHKSVAGATRSGGLLSVTQENGAENGKTEAETKRTR
jgi:cytoskeletal protein CcmA (bactofilin family)